MRSVDDGIAQPMLAVSGTALWSLRITLDAGLHRVAASVGTDRDTVDTLVRGEADIPRRGMPIAPGRDLHSIGEWPEHGIAGTQLGPNKNGKHW
jgi:Icc protein